mmetsp:Transcript_4056/g.3833  ORF Transcript_4056/g.3833 Transcript_4056/m.3833 type:complete len:238 (-) Transcript_4056:298-1011(-)|eukprot:CAMPEP_0197831182 /NCGR_PEP_ID=MMETSP1437-20131217/7825_1 /TAXON_ID=49252 ORGANISM="Eucampia antarctica, Strain CCMP1452" /NCGR_SAMPLE_ID=MMETSP1437 /ASSEMBLY_ACC=CAM_ASM_001096 /LENGTH=237 /DNA_ID=CAMNT_0043433977 /DNA_START=59 /DNA_END=772 /DNA_ORIENTATION=+
MVKISQIVLVPFLLMGGVSAFTAPCNTRAFVTCAPTSSVLYAEDEDASEPVSEAVSEPAGALVPIKEETVQFTAGLLGGIVGFTIGGPWLAAAGAAAANYASKQDMEAGEVISAVSKSSIQAYNYLSQLDTKYELLTKAQSSLQSSLDKIKARDNVNPETLEKVEKALDTTTTKIKDINDEYDLVGSGVSALGVIGDLVERAVAKAGELNSEYKLTDKAQEALKTAVDKAKSAADKK